MASEMRFCAIDIGTFSTRLLIAEKGRAGDLIPLDRRTAVTRLGEGLSAGGCIGDGAIARTAAAIGRFLSIGRSFRADRCLLVATEACRKAINGEDALRKMGREAGHPVRLLSGEEEARLTARGVRAALPALGEAALADVGGGSTEWIAPLGGRCPAVRSIPLGCVRIRGEYLLSDPPTGVEMTRARGHICDLLRTRLPPPPHPPRLAGFGGTITTLAAVAVSLDPYDGDRIHGKELAKGEIEEMLGRLAGLRLRERRKVVGLPAARADVILGGGLIYDTLMELLGFREITVSDRGLLFGLIEESL